MPPMCLHRASLHLDVSALLPVVFRALTQSRVAASPESFKTLNFHILTVTQKICFGLSRNGKNTLPFCPLVQKNTFYALIITKSCAIAKSFQERSIYGPGWKDRFSALLSISSFPWYPHVDYLTIALLK